MLKPEKVFPALTRFHLAVQIERWGWRIGRHTYGQPTVLEPELASLSIGSFCSIGPDVTMILGNHRTDLVSTYPFKVLQDYWGGNLDECEEDHDSKGDIVIHDDVWIGAKSIILSGAEIGHGAVVAAQSVVRGRVPAYSIVAGNPARVVRQRFDEKTVQRLLNLAWWNWDDDDIRAYLPFMLTSDIEGFLSYAEKKEFHVSGGGASRSASTPPVQKS